MKRHYARICLYLCIGILSTHTALLLSANKIIYLVPPPRSLATAFLRMMHARGDFIILNEISMLAHVVDTASTTIKTSFTKNAPPTFKDVKKMVFDAAKRGNVLVKDVPTAVMKFVIHDKDLMQNPNVYFIFLLRNPHHSMLSLYKRAYSLKNMGDCSWYQHSNIMFNIVKNKAANKPLIVRTEDLYTNPQGTIKTMCERLGIPYTQAALSWDDWGDNFEGNDTWIEIKDGAASEYWHSDAMRSTGFGKPSTYDVDANGQPTFAEVTSIKEKLLCKQIYTFNFGFYRKLMEETWAICYPQS